MSIARYFAKPTKTTTVFPSVSTTVFTVTGGYPVGQLDVFLNGVRLVSGDDYTATNGTSFTLTNAAISGDVVQHTVYPVSPLNYLNSTGGTLTGQLALSYDTPVLQFTHTPTSQAWRIGTTASNIYFQDLTSNTFPFIIANGAPNNVMSVSATGAITMAAGQIVFPATANISANANTLDDEGTWTPTMNGSTGAPTVTYATGTYGHYTKIGKCVVLQGRIVLSAASGGSGNLRIGGLPFASSNAAGQQALSIGVRNQFTTQGPNNAYLLANSNVIILHFFSATGTTAITTANLAAASDITFGGVYMTDA